MSSNRRMHNWFLCGKSDRMENDKRYIFLLKIKTWHRLSAKPLEACLHLQAGINYSDWKMCFTIFFYILGKPSKYWVTAVGQVWLQFSPVGKWTERLRDKRARKDKSKQGDTELTLGHGDKQRLCIYLTGAFCPRRSSYHRFHAPREIGEGEQRQASNTQLSKRECSAKMKV